MSDPDSSFEASPQHIPPSLKAKKGRGAVSNLQGRYETLKREEIDDGWSGHSGITTIDSAEIFGRDTRSPASGPEGAAAWKTRVTEEHARSILSRNRSPDVPFAVSLNPYRGCEHGCIYCFARPTHSYLGLSPGLDFESRIFAKINAPDLLKRELSKATYVPTPIALGVNTDAYQPCERELGLTRRVLEVLHECEHPVALITKSSLIERDIDLLAEMASKRQAMAALTITTLDPKVARTLEPRAAAPERRLRTIRTLADAGIPVGVSIAPVIPFVTEPDLERILAAAADAGAVNAGYIILRLPWEVSPLFRQWLETHFPDRADRVMNRIRDIRRGRDYDATFGKRMRGEGVWADLIRQRFQKALGRSGLASRASGYTGMDCSRFRAPTATPSIPSAVSSKKVSQAKNEPVNKKRQGLRAQLELF